MTPGSFMSIDNAWILKDFLNSGILEKTLHGLLIACHLSDLKHEFVEVRRKSIDRLEKTPGGAELERFL